MQTVLWHLAKLTARALCDQYSEVCPDYYQVECSGYLGDYNLEEI